MSGATLVRRLAGLEVEVGDLVASHTPDADRDYTPYANDPIAFIREVLGETEPGPWEAQVEIAEAVRDQPFVAVPANNSAGKDWLAGRLALWWVYARLGLCIVTGPSQRQVREIVFGQIARAFVPELPGELFQAQLRIARDEERGIIGVVSNTVSRMTGFHGARVLVILTEAQGIEAPGWEAMQACRTGDEDRTLALANPLFPSGPFFEACRRPHWRVVKVSAEQHPNVVAGHTVIPGGPSRTWIETMAAEYGRGSSTFKARVEGEFPDQGEQSLFSRAWLEAAADRWEIEKPVPPPLGSVVDGVYVDVPSGPQPFVAVDPARYGPDSTCLAVRYGNRIERITTWRGKSTTETVERIVEEARTAGVRPASEPVFDVRSGQHHSVVAAWGWLVIDVVGLGAGIADSLRDMRYQVHDFNGGQFTWKVDRKRFLNTRAASYWRLRKLFEDGQITVPRNTKLFDELMATNWFPTAEDKVQIEPKEKLKGTLGRSPDHADAVCMAFATELFPVYHAANVPSPWG